MCGIIGYVGYRRCQDILFDGLKRLEYRGYDSAGVAWREDGIVQCVRAVGNLDSLESALGDYTEGRSAAIATATTTAATSPCSGIGHTRWATHGGVTESNAHPHEDASGRVRIVLNGIIENYIDLRKRLEADTRPVQLRHGRGGRRAADRALLRRRPGGGGASLARRSLGPLRVRRDVRRRAGHVGGRAARMSVGRGNR